MFFALVLCSLVALFALGVANPLIGGSPVGEVKVKYGGRKEVIGRTEYPYMVFIELVEIFFMNETHIDKGIHHCGGVIIRRGAVLTAAHCLTEPLTTPYVYIFTGIIDKELERDKVRYSPMLDYVIHEGYITEEINLSKRKYQHNDLAIIWVQQLFHFDSLVFQIELLSPFTKVTSRMGYILGWGATKTQKNSDKLLKGEMRVISRESCLTYYEDYDLTQEMLCAMSDKKSVMSCKGDSGGPLIIDNKLAGIMSFNTYENITYIDYGVSVLECDPTKPAVLTYVPKYKNWIEQKLHKGPPRDRIRKCKKL